MRWGCHHRAVLEGWRVCLRLRAGLAAAERRSEVRLMRRVLAAWHEAKQRAAALRGMERRAGLRVQR